MNNTTEETQLLPPERSTIVIDPPPSYETYEALSSARLHYPQYEEPRCSQQQPAVLQQPTGYVRCTQPAYQYLTELQDPTEMAVPLSQHRFVNNNDLSFGMKPNFVFSKSTLNLLVHIRNFVLQRNLWLWLVQVTVSMNNIHVFIVWHKYNALSNFSLPAASGYSQTLKQFDLKYNVLSTFSAQKRALWQPGSAVMVVLFRLLVL